MQPSTLHSLPSRLAIDAINVCKRSFRRIGTELGLMGFSQYSLRHFMADQIRKLFRNVPREQRSLWMGHVVRDGLRTTANYESDDPDMLADVALATDCVIALIQQHCARQLFAVDVLLTKKDLQAIGVWIGAGVRRRSAPGSVIRHLQDQAFSLEALLIQGSTFDQHLQVGH